MIDDVPEATVTSPASAVNRDRPGASVDRQFEGRRDRHKARVRATWPAIVGRGSVIVFVGLGLVAAAPPTWALAGWAFVAVGVLSTISRLVVLPQHVASWETGGEGERATAARLDPLRSEGFVVFHDRRIPRSVANIDHIVVGPTGVWVIETKSYGGRLRVQGGELRVNGRRRAGIREEVEREAGAVARVVAPIRVTPLIVVHRADFPLFGSLRLGGIPVVSSGELVKRIQRKGAVLTADQIVELAAALDAALPPALGG